MKEWNLISLAEARRLAIEALAAAPTPLPAAKQAAAQATISGMVTGRAG